MGAVRFIPPSASTFASQYDALFWFFMLSCGLAFLATSAVMVYFALRYRRGAGRYEKDKGHSHTMVEVLWSMPVLFVVTALFVWGARLYVNAYTPPEDATEIYVTGKQWMWKLQHPSGKREINEMHIPVDTPIKLTMTSEDVIHSFFVPAFRLKRDVLPGRYTSMWFEATEPGEYHLFCAEYCGTEHSRMVGKVVVMGAKQYQDWIRGDESQSGDRLLASVASKLTLPEKEAVAEAADPANDEASADGAPDPSMVAAGETLFQQKACVGCHNQNPGAACPNLHGAWGELHEMQSGELVAFDENYVTESILYPQRKLVKGYPPIMPAFEGQLTQEEISQLIAYIKSLK